MVKFTDLDTDSLGMIASFVHDHEDLYNLGKTCHYIKGATWDDPLVWNSFLKQDYPHIIKAVGLRPWLGLEGSRKYRHTLFLTFTSWRYNEIEHLPHTNPLFHSLPGLFRSYLRGWRISVAGCFICDEVPSVGWTCATRCKQTIFWPHSSHSDYCESSPHMREYATYGSDKALMSEMTRQALTDQEIYMYHDMMWTYTIVPYAVADWVFHYTQITWPGSIFASNIIQGRMSEHNYMVHREWRTKRQSDRLRGAELGTPSHRYMKKHPDIRRSEGEILFLLSPDIVWKESGTMKEVFLIK